MVNFLIKSLVKYKYLLYNSKVSFSKGCCLEMESHKWKDFFSYYKWHILFIVLVIVCVCFIFTSLFSEKDPDLIMGYVGTNYVDTQMFEDNKDAIQGLSKSATSQKKAYIILEDYPVNTEEEILSWFEDMIETHSYHIYIAPKKAFLNHKNKSDFATIKNPMDNVDCLIDDNGRTYAVSIEDNSYMKRLGFSKREGLYIAAADYGEEELSVYEKNGINITNFIIENRKTYNN